MDKKYVAVVKGEVSLDDFLNEISLVSDVTEHEEGNNKVI